jgi:hypothetical protein
MDRVNDLSRIDPLEIGGCGSQIGVGELALNDVDQHTLPSELHRMSVPELMWREPSANTSFSSKPPKFSTNRRGRPRPATGRSVDDPEQRTDRQLDSKLEPAVEMLKAPVVHPDLAALITLAMAD